MLPQQHCSTTAWCKTEKPFEILNYSCATLQSALKLIDAHAHTCSHILSHLQTQRAHWQAHDGAIASVDLIPAGAAAALVGSCSAADCGNGGGASVADNATASGSNSSTTGAATTSNTATASSSSSSSQQVLILTGSRDCNVAVWTLDGGLVGVLGEHSWDLDNSGTWQDPQGLHKRPPRQTQAGGGQEEEDAEEDEGAEVGGSEGVRVMMVWPCAG